MPTSALSPSGNLSYYSSLQPYRRPLVSFLRNKAHSCMSGFDIFDQLSSSHAINKNAGWNNSTLHVMDQCTWYANDTAVYAGIGGPNLNQQENVIYRDNVFVDNKTGLMLATYNVTEESVFVADSGERDCGAGSGWLYRTYDGAGRVRNSPLHRLGRRRTRISSTISGRDQAREPPVFRDHHRSRGNGARRDDRLRHRPLRPTWMPMEPATPGAGPSF